MYSKREVGLASKAQISVPWLWDGKDVLQMAKKPADHTVTPQGATNYALGTGRLLPPPHTHQPLLMLMPRFRVSARHQDSGDGEDRHLRGKGRGKEGKGKAVARQETFLGATGACRADSAIKPC